MNSVTLKWVRGHSGYYGNVTADLQARHGRDHHVSAHPDSPNMPKSALDLAVNQASTCMWRKIWNREQGCSQTRLWFPEGPRPNFAFSIIRLPRVICSQVTQFITGHSFMNRHQAIIDNADRARFADIVGLVGEAGEEILPLSSAECRRCGEGEEKPEHLMSRCTDPAIIAIRMRIFAHPFPQPPYTDIKVFQLVAFLKEVKMPSLEMRPYLEEYDPTSIPGEALPTPPPQIPIVEGAEEVSSEDEGNRVAARLAAETAGGLLLHNYLYTRNDPLRQDPRGAQFY